MAISFSAGTPTASKFTIFPKGNYPFEIVDAKEGKMDKDGSSLPKGTQFIELTLKIKNPTTEETVKVFDNLYFHSKTAWKIDSMLKAIGKHPGEGALIEIDCFDLIGSEGFADIKVGKNNKGDERNEVAAFTWEA
jgi:hypothetical protein